MPDTQFQRVISSQRPTPSRKVDDQTNERNSALTLLQNLLAQRNEHPNPANTNNLMSALPNAIARTNDSHIQDQLIDYFSGLQQSQAQSPSQQQRPQMGGRRGNLAQSQPQELSASDYNEQQRQQNLAYNNTAALQNTIGRFQSVQQDSTDQDNSAQQQWAEQQRYALAKHLGYNTSMTDPQTMTVDGQQILTDRRNPNVPNMGALNQQMANSPIEAQVKAINAGVWNQDGGKTDIVNEYRKQQDSSRMGHYEDINKHLINGDWKMLTDAQGNPKLKTRSVNPDATPQQVMLGQHVQWQDATPFQRMMYSKGVAEGHIQHFQGNPGEGIEAPKPSAEELTKSAAMPGAAAGTAGTLASYKQRLANQSNEFTGRFAPLSDQIAETPMDTFRRNFMQTGNDISTSVGNAGIGVTNFAKNAWNTVSGNPDISRIPYLSSPQIQPSPLDSSANVMRSEAIVNGMTQGYPIPTPPQDKQLIRRQAQRDLYGDNAAEYGQY